MNFIKNLSIFQGLATPIFIKNQQADFPLNSFAIFIQEECDKVLPVKWAIWKNQDIESQKELCECLIQQLWKMYRAILDADTNQYTGGSSYQLCKLLKSNLEYIFFSYCILVQPNYRDIFLKFGNIGLLQHLMKNQQS